MSLKNPCLKCLVKVCCHEKENCKKFHRFKKFNAFIGVVLFASSFPITVSAILLLYGLKHGVLFILAFWIICFFISVSILLYINQDAMCPEEYFMAFVFGPIIFITVLLVLMSEQFTKTDDSILY